MTMSVRSAGFLAGLLVASGLLAGPVLEVTPKEFDFGRKEKNDGAYPFEFVLKNTGDAVLKLEKVRPGCGCTKVDVAKKELAPGEEVKLTGVLETKHFEGPTQKTVYVTTNEDAKAANHYLNLKIILPYGQKGLRIAPRNTKTVLARPQGDKIRAYINIENCNREGELHVQEIVLPEGWTCETALPVAIKGEARAQLRVSRALGDGQPFPDLPFALKTDCSDAPELQAAFKYHDIKKVVEAQTEALKNKAAQAQQDAGKTQPPGAAATPVIGPEPPPAEGSAVNAEKAEDE